ncbi:MAG: ComEC/Rec2 family competence protein [Clostridia bacterium]|nr:ComEC/Rec2 family competence protein [Clostridia bacterium]
MISRPFALVGLSFVFALLVFNLVEGSAVVFLICAVGCILIAAFVKSLPERANYIVCAVSILSACVSFMSTEKLDYSQALGFIGEDASDTARVNDISTVSTGTYYTLDASEINGVQVECKLRLYQKNKLAANVDDELSFVGDIEIIGADEESHNYYKSKGIFLKCTADNEIAIAESLKKTASYYIRIIKDYICLTLGEFVSGDSGSLAVSMLTGDKGTLSAQVNNAFKVCGLSHTLAVSGLHMNIIVLALYKLVSRIFSKAKRFSALICIPIALLYAAVTGFSVSAVRACTMIIVMLLGKVISRKSDSLNSLGFAALIITLINPYAVLDWSFMLSFSSALGIVVFLPMLKKAEIAIRRRVKQKFVSDTVVSLFDAVAVSCVATVFTMPVMILFVGSFSLMVVPANLAVFFAVPIMMVSSAVTAVLGLLPFSFPAEVAAFVCRWTGKYILWVVELFSQPNFARVNVNSFALKLWLAVAFTVVALAIYLIKDKKRVSVFCSVFICVSLALTGVSSAVLNKGAVAVTAVDVDDGACFVVSYGTSAVLIGCSGDEYVVGNVLNELGIIRVELAILPQFTEDNDHCLQGLFERYDFGQTVSYSNCEFDSLPENTVRTDSFTYDFHGRKIEYISDGRYDYCTLYSDAGSALFVFGADTPRELVADTQADFLFSRSQPPEWSNTSDYSAVIISAGGNTVINNPNTYSTNDNSDFTLSFNEWKRYKINLV